MKKFLSIFLAMIIALSVCLPAAATFCKKEETLRLVVPENWEMDVGDSRSVEAVFSDSVTQRTLVWTAEPVSVATVDEWGRVTAVSAGTATITAESHGGLKDCVTLSVVNEATKTDVHKEKHDYNGEAVEESDGLQKIVTRYPLGSGEVPEAITDKASYSNAQTATTADNAVWTITDYGVLRTVESARFERDKEQRFMGQRYFYSADTGDGKVLAIFPDGENGIWTVMEEGYTHIAMTELNGTDKAALMSENTQKYVSRRGMVANSYFTNGEWRPSETDNDGLWTSMYGAGELMRYAVLRDDPTASQEEISEARKTAYLSTEAVLMLTYISMRSGTTQAYVRAQRNGSVTDLNTGKYYTTEVLKQGGDYSQYVPESSPAAAFEEMYLKYNLFGTESYIMKDTNLELLVPGDWAMLGEENETPATRTRLLTGFWARTYSLKDEGNDLGGNIYWSHNGDGTATGVSTKTPDKSEYLLNGENLRGVKVDASGEIPERLWNDLIGSSYEISDVVYKGDTSADEIIGHLFIYKLAYDILGDEDPEIKALLVNTMDKFAQHLVDNSYTLCDGSGQPVTWGKFNRAYYHNGQSLGGAALQTALVLSIFKLAAYITGEQKWEDEYRMAALDPAYEYAKVLTQERDRYKMAILEYLNDVSPVLGFLFRPLMNTKFVTLIYRLILNYSDEEMAMMIYYLLFQLEDDETLLGYYREGLEDWWFSISQSENPCWYYIYQLAYPNETKTDMYGNNILETAAWALNRHPVETIKYNASNENRDDIAEVNLGAVGLKGLRTSLSYDPSVKKPLFADSDSYIWQIVGLLLCGGDLEWCVPAPDERTLHKFNSSTYQFSDESQPNAMEGSTTYTLPYWMGRYHNMIK